MKEAQLHIKGDEPPFEAPHYPLPTDKARFVGEAVAMVVAETVHAAKDGAERVEIDYDILPAVVETVAAARQDAPRVHDGATVECLLRWRAWRCGGDRRRLCPRRPRDPVRDLGAARHRRADGAARRARRLRSADRPLHGLCRQRRRGAAEERSRHHARRAAGKSPRADAGRRRQFRHPRHDLCRVRAGGMGGEKARPAGEMDHRAPRVVPERLPGARSRRRSRAGARRQGQVPGDARLQSRQSRRPHHQFRHGAKGRADDVEHLPDAGGAFPRPRHA